MIGFLDNMPVALGGMGEQCTDTCLDQVGGRLIEEQAGLPAFLAAWGGMDAPLQQAEVE